MSAVRQTEPITLRQAVAEYLDAITAIRAPKTVEEYERDLLAATAVIEREMGCPASAIALMEVTTAHLRAAVGAYASAADARYTQQANQAPQRRAASSIARRTSALRSLFGWCHRQGLLEANPAALLDLPPKRSRVPRAFDADDANRIIEAVYRVSKWPERDLVVILLALACGLRLGEISSLGTRDLVGNPMTRMVVRGKGGHERTIPLPPALVEAIAVYLPTRRARLAELGIEAASLIISSRPRPVRNPDGSTHHSVDGARRAIEYCVDQALHAVHLRRNGTLVHALRHTFATLALREGALNIRQVQTVLGHADLSTTQIYTAVSDEEIAAGMNLHSLGRRRPQRGILDGQAGEA